MKTTVGGVNQSTHFYEKQQTHTIRHSLPPHVLTCKTLPTEKGANMTQYEKILQYINDFGSISPMEAFSDLGITKLATRISEMRKDGIEFEQVWECSKNRYGDDVRYMRYSRSKS